MVSCGNINDFIRIPKVMTKSSLSKIPIASPSLIGNEKKYVVDCLESNWISSNGVYIEKFEYSFASYIGARHSIACCNGTTALHLALLALGIGFGDEVIVPTLTYVATANAVAYTGAEVVLADCDPLTWNINPDSLESLITRKTKAIIPVPLFGHPCDLEPIFALGEKYGLYVVEDSAEALGAKYKGNFCGSLADISTFSFYGNKTITTGEGGMVVTNDDALAARIRLYKGQGMDPAKRYWFPVIGYNYRMTNIAAAIGLAQLENIDLFLNKRRKIAAWYTECLSEIPGIVLPTVKEYAEHSWWMYSVLVEDGCRRSRDEMIEALAAHGIETRPFFYPMHTMPVYARRNTGNLYVSESVASKGMNLPTYYDLSREDVEFIARVLKDNV